MVDMETKAISKTRLDAKKSGKWHYPDKQQFCQKKGSGNNWAHGFCAHGPKAHDDIMALVQSEVEKCDHFDGFLTLMSLAGGTGSGVGAYITQCLRDEYPHSFIMNQVVWPYNTGEVIVQNYNALLTLSQLYLYSDALLIMENDKIQKICSQLLNIKHISFQDMNTVIAHKLASFLQPTVRTEGSHTRQNRLGDMLEHLVAHPDYKLLSLLNIPQMSEAALQYSAYQWPGLLKHLRQMLIANAPMEEGIDWNVRVSSGAIRNHNFSLANLLLLRGKDCNMADVSAFTEPKLYTDWIPSGCGLLEWKQPRMFCQYEKSASLLSNSQTPVTPLNSVLEKSWSMFGARAFVHQYIKFGLAEEDFLDSFASLEQVLKNYKDL
ncbi:tubulin delta chain isoform X2 [Lingula anatina]|nr:tubulin delta chain isoform X2 [Lingula anatina]|eukprot:XP_013394040.1 tubulin delta chain isoform X2 [Lingula anatina]